MSNKTSADQIFSILAFQYRPIEKALLEELEKEGRDDVISRYKKSEASVKIMLLDKFAAYLGF